MNWLETTEKIVWKLHFNSHTQIHPTPYSPKVNGLYMTVKYAYISFLTDYSNYLILIRPQNYDILPLRKFCRIFWWNFIL